MKKFFLVVATCSTLVAQAGTYNFLVFTNNAGTKTAFDVNNLTLNVDGSNLQVTNVEGTVNMLLTDLKSMQFSTDGTITRLEDLINTNAPVQVFSISGTSLGVYGSLVEAAKMLNAGVYLISNGSVTQTVVVK